MNRALLALAALLTTSLAQGQDAPPPRGGLPDIAFEDDVTAHVRVDVLFEVEIDPVKQNWRTYTIEVPEGAKGLGVVVLGRQQRVNFYLRHGAAMTDYEKADHDVSGRVASDAAIYIDRLTKPPLRPGIYYLDVASIGSAPDTLDIGIRYGSLDECLARLEEAVRLDPKDTVARLIQGRLASAARNFPAALSAFDAAVTAAPDSARALFLRAGVRHRTDPRGAGADYQRSVELEPRYGVNSAGEVVESGNLELEFPEKVGYRTLTVEVPEGAQRLEIRTAQGPNPQDADLFLRYELPMWDWVELDHMANSKAKEEILVVDATSDPPLRSGRYYLDVGFTEKTGSATVTLQVELE